MPLQLSPDQKHVIDCVLSIFETGKVPSAASYATCTILKDGAGISYGKHQCTDKAGSLDAVVKRYIALGGRLAAEMRLHEGTLAANASTKETPGGPYSAPVQQLIDVLKAAGTDPVMQRAQDEVFDEQYFAPALAHAEAVKASHALTVLVLYDTCIHSGPKGVDTIRAKFPEKSPANGGDEKAWTRAYIAARRAWLAGNSNPLVQKTVYRMDALQAIAEQGNWSLAMPLTVRNQKIG